MNKVIIMTEQPKWLVKILNGEKTIEIRKTMSKCELPIDVYLYCTKGTLYFNAYENEWQTSRVDRKLLNPSLHHRSGKVVAKFTLNNVEDCCDMSRAELEHKSRLSISEICLYIKAKEVDPKMVYAWHIDDLVIFNEPMELREFSTFKRETIYCGMDCPPYTDWVEYRVRKAPQSWQYAYVED